MILTLDGRFLQANRAFCSITEYSEDELRKRDYASITHPDDRGRMRLLIGDLVSGKIPAFVVEERHFTKDGRTIWVSNSVSVIRDVRDQAEYLIGLCEDITLRKDAEAALRAPEEQFRTIVDATPECVKVVNADGTLLHMNAAGLERRPSPAVYASYQRGRAPPRNVGNALSCAGPAK